MNVINNCFSFLLSLMKTIEGKFLRWVALFHYMLTSKRFWEKYMIFYNLITCSTPTRYFWNILFFTNNFMIKYFRYNKTSQSSAELEGAKRDRSRPSSLFCIILRNMQDERRHENSKSRKSRKHSGSWAPGCWLVMATGSRKIGGILLERVPEKFTY